MAKFLFMDFKPWIPRIKPIIAKKGNITPRIKAIRGTNGISIIAGDIKRPIKGNIIIEPPVIIPKIRERIAFIFGSGLNC